MENEHIPLWRWIARKVDGVDYSLQTPDLATATDFWRMYRLSPQELLVARARIHLDVFSPISPEQISQMIPDKKWYTSPEHATSVHGVQHSLRVALYAEILGQRMGLTQEERRILLAVSLLHDIGRENDEEDKDHGVRSARSWKALGNILEDRGIALSEDQRNTVEILCINHEKPYNEIFDKIKSNSQIHKLLKYFMAVDALDRYRLPNEKWWPSSGYFWYDSELQQFFEDMMPFARDFTLWSEYYRLQYPSIPLNKVFIHLGQDNEMGLVTKDTRDEETMRRQQIA